MDINITDRLVEGGWVGPRALTLKVGVLEEIWACDSRVKFVHRKYESPSNLVSIEHWTDAPRHCMFVHQNHVYTASLEMPQIVL